MTEIKAIIEVVFVANNASDGMKKIINNLDGTKFRIANIKSMSF